MKKCIFCKTDNVDEAKYCQKCGRSFELTCPKCGALNAGDAIYCVQCGANIVLPKNRKNKAILIILSSILGIAIIGLIIAFLNINKKHTSSPENVINKDTIVENVDSVKIVNIEKETDTPAEDNESEKQNNNVNVGKVTDIDGNIYNTVKIGNQVWMKENMKATHSYNGVAIPFYSTWKDVTPSLCNGYSANISKYGYLYNLNAAKIVCPQGWHLPSPEDFTVLQKYCEIHYGLGMLKKGSAKALAATSGWKHAIGDEKTEDVDNNWAVCTNQYQNNKSGFSAIPLPKGETDNTGTNALFWTSKEEDSDGYGEIFNICYRFGDPWFTAESSWQHYSVRCIRD